MTYNLTLSYAGVTVDLSALNCDVSHRYANPVIAIPTPPPTTGATPVLVSINIGFSEEDFGLSFKLVDGRGTLDFITPGSTNYEKLVYLSHIRNPKTLTIDGRAITVQIVQFNISWNSGDKDLAANCSMDLQMCANITME
jgi:hypothetical protein